MEEFCALTGEPVLVVDLDAGATGADPDALARARAALATLACPSVGLCRRGPATGELAPQLDVVVSSADDLDTVVAAVRKTPLAALALAQLLRHSQGLSVHEALIAESLVYSVLQSGPEFGAWREARGEPRRRRENPEPAVRVQRSPGRLELVLNRPEKRNAFSAEMRDALVEGLHVAVSDPSLREVVLRGEGPAFCSGGDLDEFGTLPDPATAHVVRSVRHPARLLASCAERVRVELHGACVGAGIELPAFAGHVVAKRDAFFNLPEVGFGLVPGAGGTVSIPRRIGRQRTAWLALSGVRLDAREALAWGLIDEVAAS